MANDAEPKTLRAAAYCRVSSDSADQLHSYAAQIRNYKVIQLDRAHGGGQALSGKRRHGENLRRGRPRRVADSATHEPLRGVSLKTRRICAIGERQGTRASDGKNRPRRLNDNEILLPSPDNAVLPFKGLKSENSKAHSYKTAR